MSITTKKTREVKALPLSDTLRDLALLRATDVDLTALLSSSTGSENTIEGSLTNSSEFINVTRSALRLDNRGDIDKQGKKLDEVRRKFEDFVDGLAGSNHSESTEIPADS